MARRMTMLALAALALSVGALAVRPVAAAQPTSEDLAALTLGMADLPEGYALTFDQVGNVPIPPYDAASYQAAYQRDGAGQFVQLSLFGFPVVVSDEFVQSLFEGFASGLGQAAAADGPALGQRAYRALLAKPESGEAASGELLLWQQGEVLVMLMTVGLSPEETLTLAQQQQARLAALPAPSETPSAEASTATTRHTAGREL